MQEYFIVVAKYLITLCMAFYTMESFLSFLYSSDEDKNVIYIRSSFWMFLMQLAAFANLALVAKDWNYVYMYGFVQLFLLTVLVITPILYRKCNRLLVNHMCMMLGIGMIVLSRLSAFTKADNLSLRPGLEDLSGFTGSKAFRQLIIICASFVLCLAVPLIMRKLRNLHKYRWIYAAVGILLLSAVLVMGEVTHGSKISFTVQGITFQPSEFVKLIFVFFLAASLWQDISLKNIMTTSVLAGIQVIVLVLSTDLGGALIFFVGYLSILFIAGRNYLYLLLGLVGGAGASVIAYQLFSHVRVRVLSWLDPWSYIDNQGYQITQSLFAIGSGSWFGMGLHEGNPKAIPFVEADFIFSSISEEFGTIFAVLLILVILNCFLAMMKIAIEQRSNFFRLICVGLGTMYIFQVFLTIGGGIKFIPLTGVTLPLISYGGSSVMSTMLMFYVLQGIYIINRKEGERHVRRRKKAGNKTAGPQSRTKGRTSADEGHKSENERTEIPDPEIIELT